jgi:hypothetical protein
MGEFLCGVISSLVSRTSRLLDFGGPIMAHGAWLPKDSVEVVVRPGRSVTHPVSRGSMARNIGTAVAVVVGTVLLCITALDWNAYTEFLASLNWK